MPMNPCYNFTSIWNSYIIPEVGLEKFILKSTGDDFSRVKNFTICIIKRSETYIYI